MDPLTLMMIFLVALVLIVSVYAIKQIQQLRSDLQGQVSELQQTFSQRFDSNVRTVTDHLGIITGQISNTTNVVAQVEGKLGQVHEANRQIMDLARQMSSLEDILRSPKMRGGLGEFLLADLLSQCLQADMYRPQYPFQSGEIVDMAIFVGKKIVPVDSKFPLENFRRLVECETDEQRKAFRKQFLADVKKHVNSIAAKYILPDEGTFDFALMFIPAENVYYELIVRDEKDLYTHCIEKKVIPVSPNTFFAYLQVIWMGLQGFQISEKAKLILAQLQQIANDLSRFESDFAKIGSHLGDAQKSFDRSGKSLQKLKGKVAAMGTPDLEEVEEALSIGDPERT